MNMKTLFHGDGYREIESRFLALRPDAGAEWGKMHVAQMLAHCRVTMEVATGLVELPPSLMGKLIGRWFRRKFSDDSRLSRNSPTHPRFVMTEQKDFAAERDRLLQLIRQFAEGGEANCTGRPHSFFGPLSSEEWGRGMYKHLDHHLRQFGA